MTQQIVVADVAGRVVRNAAGSPKVTCAAVVIDPANVEPIQSILSGIPKWSKCTHSDSQTVAGLLGSYCEGMAAFSLDLDTDAWKQFWDDAMWACAQITKQDRKRVGFARPATIARYLLFGDAMAAATAHAAKKGNTSRILDAQGLEIIERTLIVDSDFSGQETIRFLENLWTSEMPQPRIRSLGIKLTTKAVRVATEEEEPLLLLADYLAGLVHCVAVGSATRTPFPINATLAKEQLQRVSASKGLPFKSEKFDVDYGDIFKEFRRVYGKPSD